MRSSWPIVGFGMPDPTNPRYNGRGAYYENLIMHSPVKLQGVGAGGFQCGDANVGAVFTIAALAPGASKTVTVTWKATRGAHTVTSTVDPNNLVAESNETDNKLQKAVAVK